MLLILPVINLFIHIIAYAIRDELHHRCILRSRSIQNFKGTPQHFSRQKALKRKESENGIHHMKEGLIFQASFFSFFIYGHSYGDIGVSFGLKSESIIKNILFATPSTQSNILRGVWLLNKYPKNEAEIFSRSLR